MRIWMDDRFVISCICTTCLTDLSFNTLIYVVRLEVFSLNEQEYANFGCQYKFVHQITVVYYSLRYRKWPPSNELTIDLWFICNIAKIWWQLAVELDRVIDSWLITHYKTYKIKCAITCSPVVKFFDVIYPVLDEAVKAENQKQRIANTMIGIDYAQVVNFQVSP